VTIGLGTYAFFWQWHATAETPLSLTDMVDRTADLGVHLFQICDYPAVESYDSSDLDQLRVRATKRGVRLELGTRGVRPQQLRRYLEMAHRLDATLVRSMINTADHRPSPDEAVELLTSVAPAFEEAGVTVALETYEQVPVNTLVDIVTRVGSPAIGICVDPGNCIAALELPTATVEARTPLAPLIPQNHGVGFQSTAEMKRIPVGKPNPMSNPAGAMTATHISPRSTRELLSSERSRGGTHSPCERI